jgi:hypothetical protein
MKSSEGDCQRNKEKLENSAFILFSFFFLLMARHDRGLLILYGSETGTAEDVAELIGREAKRRLFNTRVMAMDTYARVHLITYHFFGISFTHAEDCSFTGQRRLPSATRTAGDLCGLHHWAGRPSGEHEGPSSCFPCSTFCLPACSTRHAGGSSSGGTFRPRPCRACALPCSAWATRPTRSSTSWARRSTGD